MRKRNLLAMLVLPILLSLVSPALGYYECNLTIDPPVIWNLDYGPGTEFTVEINVDYVEKLWAFQFELGEAGMIPGYDPTVLELIDFGIPGYVPGQPGGGFLGSNGGTIAWYPGTVDNNEGYLTLSVGALDPKRKFPTGGGTLATMTFRVVGWGWSPIHFGLDTGLMDYEGLWVIRGTITPDAIHDGFFSNVQGPELYIRRAGAHGGGVWPEWQVGFFGTEQTLYSRIANQGELGAEVYVEFYVESAVGVQRYESTVEYVREKLPHPIGPGVVTVSATFEPPAMEHYYVKGYLYFKVEGMDDFQPYEMVIEGGGEGEYESRDIAEHYKVNPLPL